MYVLHNQASNIVPKRFILLSLFSLFLLIILTVSQNTNPLSTSEFINNSLVSTVWPQMLEAYGKIPLSFEANQGQVDSEVAFLSRGNGYTMYLTSDEAIMVLNKPITDEATGVTGVVRLQLMGTNPHPQAVGEEELPGKVNYFIGNDPEQWRTDIPTYGSVRYEDVYPGIDLVYYGNQRQLEYDFVVRPGVDPSVITLGFDGVDEIQVDADGSLLLSVGEEQVVQRPPLAYQEIDGQPHVIESGYTLTDADTVHFVLGEYNRNYELIIDPILVFASYLGGAGTDTNRGIVVDADGNVILSGQTQSLDFPVTAGAQSTTLNGNTNAYITKLDSSGTSLIFSTYIGGSAEDYGFGVDIDTNNHIYVTGRVRSTDFPVTPGAYDLTRNSTNDAFVVKLDATGNSLHYATYLGGGLNDDGYAIMVDALGRANVVGATQSADFPTTLGAYQETYNGGTCTFGTLTGNCLDVFVVQLNAAGSALEYSTYFGGSENDYTYRATMDGNGNVYVMGYTDSLDLPTTVTGTGTNYGGGDSDAFVTKLNSGGTTLGYSTYLGGTGGENPTSRPVTGGIAVDSLGNAYITGLTSSTDFPTTAGAFDTTYNGSQEPFITKLDTVGDIVYSTFIGGTNNDYGAAIDVDSAGNAYITGNTISPNLPVTSDAFQPVRNGQDAFLLVLDATGQNVIYGSFLGGISGVGLEIGISIVVDNVGDVYIAGLTRSTDFPVTTGAFDQTYGGGFEDGFVAKIHLPCIVTNLNDSGPGSLRAAINCANSNPGPDTVTFQVAGTINVLSQLPDLSDTSGGTLIDGTTAPGYAGTPVIVLDGPGTSIGVHITSAGNEVHGLQIGGFSIGISINGAGATGNLIVGNFIGNDGTTAISNSLSGIYLHNASDNIIGGTTPSERNVISGNSSGVYINNSNANNNIVQGNYIGTDASGMSAIGNFRGIEIGNGGSNNLIGGTVSGAGNLISGNNNDGVLLVWGSNNNTLQGNLIGTDVTGVGPLGNGASGPSGDGVEITFSSNNLIGGTSPEARNVIAANVGRGIIIQDSLSIDNVVQGNYIGVAVNGTIPLGNNVGGISNSNAVNTVIGGSTPGAGNVVSANGSTGITISGSGVVVQGNFVGTDATGTVALGNPRGVFVSGTSHTIGGTMPAARNLISGNANEGIEISGSSSTGILVQGNYIGTDVTGSIALGNGASGVLLFNAPGNLIGGTTPGAGNVVSGNAGDGIEVDLSGADNNVIQGNFVGTDATGTLVIANGTPGGSIEAGIDVTDGANTVIGGTDPAARNIVSGNEGFGISVRNGATGTVIQGNYIGTDISGSLDLGNASTGIFVSATADNTLIGGTTPGAGNLISGNDGNSGIEARSIDNIIQGNFIGTDLLGSTAIGNRFYGITLQGATSNTVGGSIEAARNTISGNGSTGGAGIRIGSGSGNVIQGNFIGTDISGGTALANIGDGIQVSFSVNNTLEDNIVAFNTGVGISIAGSSSVQNEILQNSIFENAGLGIDLNNSVPDGVTVNDFGDGDSGANNLQNFPLLTGVTADGVNIAINGTLNSTASSTFTLEFFTNSTCDPTGFGEGEQLIGTVSVSTDPNGDAAFSVAFPSTATADHFTATATDANGNTSEFSACFVATPSNQPPVADDDNYSINEDVTLNEPAPGVLDGDTDADGDPLTAVLDTTTSNGSLTLNSDGSFDYTPNADYCGPDNFTYHANDGTADSNVATVTINVTCVNDPPVADDDSYSTDEDTALNIAAPGVLDGDTDVENDPLTAVLDTTTGSGSLTLNDDGSFDYTPDPDFCGTDSFTYHANDGTADSNVAAVNITVVCVNDPPAANDDNATTFEDVPVTIDAALNDTDPDGNLDSSSAIVTSGPSNATVVNNSDGTFLYTPDPNFNGSDSFVYEICDTDGLCDSATVNITVTPVNDAPVADDDSYSTDEDTTLNVPAPGVLDGDTDVENDLLTAVLNTSTTNGILNLNGDGSFDYTPNANFCGVDSFTYHANDGQADSNTATVTIDVSCVNDAPTADDDSYNTNEDTPLAVTAPGVLNGDTDVEGDTLTAVLDITTSNGSLMFNSDGSFTYTPNVNYCGSVSFTYHANDGTADSNVATVTIAVVCVNDTPVADDDSYSTNEDTTLNVSAPGVLNGDTDADGDALTAVLDTTTTNGTLTLDSDGSFSYTPDTDYCGPDSFSYHANDGADDSNVAAVTIDVVCVNDAPVADDDSYSTNEDVALNEPAPAILDGDTDVEGDALTAILDSTTSNGTLTLNSDGSFDYEPDPDFCGQDSFTYYASDGQANSNTATVTIDVTCVNDPPEVTVDQAAVVVDEGQTAVNSGTFSDVDDTTITLSASVGTVIDNDNGTWSWSFDTDDGPAESQAVTITADDGQDTGQAIFSLTVDNVAPTATFTNDGPVDEGSSFTLSLTSPFDPSSSDTTAGFEYAFDCGDGSGFGLFGSSNSTACSTTDNETRTVKGQIRDKDGGVTEYTDAVEVVNVAPSIDSIIVPFEPININDQSSFSVDVSFSDPAGAADEPYTCEFDLDYDGVTFDADVTVNNVSGTSCSTPLNYASQGVYTVKVVVTDKDSGTGMATASDLIVLYDPDGGFVTGGGWIDSPADACPPGSICEGMTGKANFGFVSKYKKGASIPTGNTEFNFSAGNLNFHSDSYDWLVINQNDTNAQYKGSGTINGDLAPNGELYKFMIWAIDGDNENPAEDDTFRIKIWYEDSGEIVVYDNGFDQPIGGGNIKIHNGS